MKLSLKSKKHFFYQLQVMLNAGIPLSEGLKSFESGSFIKAGMKWSDQMRVNGRPLSSLMLTSKLFEPYEIGLIKVGETAGQMIEVLKGLDDWLEKQLVLRRKLIVGMLYPSFILFILPIIMNIPSFFQNGTIADYFINVLLFYVPYAIAIFIFAFLIPTIIKSKSFVGRLLEEIIFHVPMIGKYIRDGYLKKIAFANSLALKSGLGVKESLLLTLSVTESPLLCCDLEKAIELCDSGVTYIELVEHFKWLDDVSKSLIATSEKTGSVADGMDQIYRIKTAENESRSMLLIIIFGTSILLYALGMVAYHIITVAIKYVNMADQYSNLP